jgi:hypothetical protein
MEGWISLHRKIINWEWWDDHNTTRLFIYLLLKANHKDGKWKGILIKKGQLVTSLDGIKNETGLKVQVIRTSIKRLKSTSEITSESTSRFTKITLCNYCDYQDEKRVANKPINKQSNKQLTNEQQTTNKQLTTNNNANNNNNDNNDNKLKGKKSVSTDILVLPECINPDVFSEYIKHRRNLKKPMTEHAKKLLIKKLLKFEQSGHNPNAVLNQSIENGWIGVFEIKQENQRNQNGTNQQYLSASERNAIDRAETRQVLDDIIRENGDIPIIQQMVDNS